MSELVDYLDEFIASLDSGEEVTASFNGAFGEEMPAFLQLITLLHTAFTPVKPRHVYTTHLKQNLLDHPVAIAETPPSHRRFWMGAATVGSILSVTGIVLFFLRRPRADTPQTQPAT